MEPAPSPAANRTPEVFDSLASELNRDGNQVKGCLRLTWTEARGATRAARERAAREPHPC